MPTKTVKGHLRARAAPGVALALVDGLALARQRRLVYHEPKRARQHAVRDHLRTRMAPARRDTSFAMTT